MTDRDTLAALVSDSLAATTEGTDDAEAPDPSDEPGSPYVLRLTNELAARGVRVAPSPTEHRHRYSVMPVWTGDEIDSWWWCMDHPTGEWVRIEDDPDAAEAIPGWRRVAPSPAPPALDVERLRKAIAAVTDDYIAQEAKAIAREYARLSAEDPTP